LPADFGLDFSLGFGLDIRLRPKSGQIWTWFWSVPVLQ